MDFVTRRRFLTGAVDAFGSAVSQPYLAAQERVGNRAEFAPREKLRITRLELFKVKPRWTFLKVHTDAGMAEAYFVSIAPNNPLASWLELRVS